MERNALFLSMLDEVKSLLNTKEEYQALRIAALLRSLLVDPPLVHEINRSHRVELRFDVESSPWLGPLHPHTIFASAAIVPHPSSTTKKLNFDQFLKWEVLVVGGHRYNVRELIKHVANISGGVHAGQVTNGKALNLEILDGLVEIADLPAVVGQLRGIAHVVLTALEPLRERVSAQVKMKGHKPQSST